MKRVLPLLILVGLAFAGCSKKDQVTPTSSQPQVNEQKATASFQISNQLSEGKILEGNILDVVNTSKNAVSYEWNFGNGTISHLSSPSDISYVPCGGRYTITLKAFDAKGNVSVSSGSYEIMCRGRNVNGKHVHDPHLYPVIHISGAALQPYQGLN